MDKNMILHLPFDDPDGSIAYDFSQYRNDATLSDGADFSKKSKVGKSLALNGTGECETARSIPFSGNFTLCFWVLPVSQKLGWVLNMPGIDNYKEQWLDVMPDGWIFFAFVKSGNMFTVYENTTRIFSEILPKTPTGLSINDQSPVSYTHLTLPTNSLV